MGRGCDAERIRKRAAGARRGGAERPVTAGRLRAAAAQSGAAGPHRGLCRASRGGGALRAPGASPDGAARPRGVRQDGPAGPLLPRFARTGHHGRMALARRGGRAGVAGGPSRARLRAGRPGDLRSGRREERRRQGGGAGPGGGQPGRVPDPPADPARWSGTARRACSPWTKWSVCGARRPWPRSTRCSTGPRAISTWGWRTGNGRPRWRSPCSRSKGGGRR